MQHRSTLLRPTLRVIATSAGLAVMAACVPATSATPQPTTLTTAATTTIAAVAPQGGANQVVPPTALCAPVAVSDSYFASGSALMNGMPAGVTQAAGQVVELHRLNVAATVVLVGHTDSRPTTYPGGNDRLSLDRAAAVRDALVAAGVDLAWIASVTGVGAAEPITTGTDSASLAMNRRVEITIVCPGL